MSSPVITPLRTPGRAPRVLTIDVEDWFHVCGDDYFSDPRRWPLLASRVEGNVLRLLDRLEAGGHRATFFFLGWIAARLPALVRETARRGHELGIHGHEHRRADEMSAQEFRADLAKALDAVESAAGVRPRVHRAAEWSIREPGAPALAILAGEGIRCDASMTPIEVLGRSSNPSGPHVLDLGGRTLVELPPLTGRGFGRTVPMGGAWPFRMFSPGRLARAEEAFRERGWPAIFTFHPWEFDSEHPPMEGLSPLVRLVHFYNLGGLPERFDRWLEGDRCVALEDVLPNLTAA
jgi:polysaccharide deacetylase family protein (PEP-CTERM system associated)